MQKAAEAATRRRMKKKLGYIDGTRSPYDDIVGRSVMDDVICTGACTLWYILYLIITLEYLWENTSSTHTLAFLGLWANNNRKVKSKN